VADLHNPVRNRATVAAFTLIIALTIAEGIDEGFSVWDWLIMALGAVFIIQALLRLNARRSTPT
jgi:uncharacterized membrane protein